MRSRHRVLSGYTAWMAALVVVYYLWPAARTGTWGLLGLSGVVAIVAGVALNRPARTAPWLLLAVAQLSFVAGQMSFLVAGLLGRSCPSPRSPTCCTWRPTRCTRSRC